MLRTSVYADHSRRRTLAVGCFRAAAASSGGELAELAAARLKVVTNQQPTAGQLADIERALAESPLPPARIAAIRRELDLWRAPTSATPAK